jgi:hypothetical protein
MSKVINPMPGVLVDLIARLEFLSMVERGQKINLHTMSFSDTNSWIAAFVRTLKGENRKSTLLHVNQLIQQTISCIEEFKDTSFIEIIVNKLAGAKQGIQNLSSTYSNDPNTVAQINALVVNIDGQLAKNKQHLLSHKSTPVYVNVSDNACVDRTPPNTDVYFVPDATTYGKKRTRNNEPQGTN